ncbi:MAG: SMP-30/gluconolactonase/LRE family protein [Nitratireductor rhodophyticola]|uniref:SMP-30/gluconolactonase/LRE family protein n=1 Tax=Nitratireductor rhodophyticola TaxID=2854036 RepID=UPI0032D98F14
MIRILGDMRDGVGESPFWNPDDGAVWSVDITGKRILQRHLGSGETQAFATEDLPTALALDAEGGAIVSFAGGVARWRDGRMDTLIAVEADPAMRLNEGACDPSGRMWVASMENNLTPDLQPRSQERARGRLFRIDGDRATAMSDAEFGIPNTMVWSPSRDRFYLGDSLRNTIWVWDYDDSSGEIANRRVHVSGGPGVPDGSCIDTEGYLWTARFGAGRVIRYDPDGQPEREVLLPARNPTATSFAGPEMTTLVVTSARFGLDNPSVADGAMFAVDTGIVGHPENRFRS